MSNQGLQLGRFRSALVRRDVEEAIDAVRQMDQVAQKDALDLCRLLATAGDSRYEATVRRWLALFAATLEDLQLATTAFGVLARNPSSVTAWETLVSLGTAH